MQNEIYHKKFLTYDEQIEKLRSKKMIIDDEDFAKNVLKQTSYFSLESGYKDIFKDRDGKNYKENVIFENLYDLYIFDEDLRGLFLKFILKIERAIKSQYSYAFCEKYGERQDEYLNVNNYNYQQYQSEVNELVNILRGITTPNSSYNYIKHNINRHKNVPLWVLVNVLTLGNVSKIFEFSKESIKSKVGKNYEEIRHKDLSKMLNVLSKFRNVCAHNERLYNYKTQKSISNLPMHINMNIAKKGDEYANGKNDLFSVVICFKYLLPIKTFDDFIDILINLMNEYKNKSEDNYYEKVCYLMGFPENWSEIKTIQKI